MNTLFKYLLLFGAFIPLLWVLYFGLYTIPSEGLGLQLGILALIGLLVLLGYILHVTGNRNLTGNRKVGWILLLILFGGIAQLIYWVRWMR